MSQPAVKALDLPFELVYSDGIPLDNYLHFLQANFLLDQIRQVMAERGRNDFFTAGDIFVYYSVEQARDVVSGRPYFRGPDVLFVDRVLPKQGRKAWVSWEEGGRLPDLIVELLSPSTEKIDRNDKMKLYSRVFRTREYFLYDVESASLEGYRLAGDLYQPIRPDNQGLLRSEVLELDLGLWHGDLKDEEATWARFLFPGDGWVPTPAEAERKRADAESRRADSERRRAEEAEAEVARLRAILLERNEKK